MLLNQLIDRHEVVYREVDHVVNTSARRSLSLRFGHCRAMARQRPRKIKHKPQVLLSQDRLQITRLHALDDCEDLPEVMNQS